MCNPIELPKVQKSHVEAAGIAAVGVAGLAAFYPPALSTKIARRLPPL